MDDLEITKRCAQKMGYTLIAEPNEHNSDFKYTVLVQELRTGYCPLHDDAQAMALLKKLHILLHCDLVNTSHVDEEWLWGVVSQDHTFGTESFDLNREICECVAKLPD